AHLTTFTMLGIRRSAARHGECRTGYHTRHHAADPKRTEPTGPAVRTRRHHCRHRQGWQSIPGGCRADRGIEERVAGRSAGIPCGSQSVLNPRTVMSLRAAAHVIEWRSFTAVHASGPGTQRVWRGRRATFASRSFDGVSFLQGLRQAGWAAPGNVHIDTRWGAGGAERIHKYAAELLALAPDRIVASGGAVAGPLLKLTRTVPIVFTLTPDPVGAGFVQSLAHPGGNATGFTSIEYGMSGKWLELMRDIAPGVTRAAVLRDPTLPAG